MIRDKANGNSIIQYAIAFTLSVCIFIFVSDAWRYNISIPYYYYNDAILTEAWIKSIIDTGWFITNPYLGAPNGYNMTAFPMADNFHFLIIKLLSFFSSNYAIILNFFYILTFPSITLTSLFTLKRFGLSYPLALTASLLFSFLPYHFDHGQAHLFLSSYYTIPLIVWLSISITLERNEALTVVKKCLKSASLLLLCLLIGSSGVYYAFFGVFYLFISGLLASITKHKWGPLVRAITLTMLISLSVLMNVMPLFLDSTHPKVIERKPLESEVYSLKITPLLLPTEYHGIKAFADFRNLYMSTSRGNAGMTGALGIIGDIGFLILIGSLLLEKTTSTTVCNKSQKFYQIARLNLCGILFATMGGFGALFAYTISPMIRCYDRMSIYIGFFSLYAFFYIFQTIWNKKVGAYHTISLWIFSFIILCFGIYDQTGLSQITNQLTKSSISIIKASVHNDKKFARRIENIIPAGSSIFQLPYIMFPEGGGGYDHFRPYLYSHHLKWSFGAMQDSQTDRWQNKVAQLPTSEMLKVIINAGFSGIYIDRDQYINDHGRNIETEISQLTGKLPIVSENLNQSFFDLRDLSKR